MSVFTSMESRLVQFATEQQACLTRDRGGESLRPSGPTNSGFEERRIDWQRDGFHLAVIIQPTFTARGVDSSKWNVYTVAWQDLTTGRHVAGQDLLMQVPFQQIEAQLEGLLTRAGAYLNGLRQRDLKPQVAARQEDTGG